MKSQTRERSAFRRAKLTIAVATTVGTAAALTSGVTSANAAQEEAPLAVSIQDTATYTDSTGAPLTEMVIDGAAGESVVTGRTRGGVPAQVLIQSALDVEMSEAEPEPIDPALVTAADAVAGVLPPDEVGTAFTPDDQPVEKEQFVDDQLTFNTNELKPAFVAGTTPTTASLAWKPVPGAVSYTVSRDGAVVGSDQSSPSHSDIGLAANRTYEYEIESLDATGTSIASKLVPVHTIGASLARGKGARSYQTYTTAFMYKTFIPDNKVNTGFFATVGCGLAGKSGWGFKGDNRGYRIPTASAPWSPQDYRTMMFINVNWDNPAPYDVITAKDVGATHVLNDKNVVQDARTASSANMTFTNTYKSGAYAQTVIAHRAGNPFCAAGAITYDATVRLYRSGTIEVVGSRYPVPNHELYGRWSNSSGTESWRTIAQLGNQSFDCLTGQCGRTSFNVSKTY